MLDTSSSVRCLPSCPHRTIDQLANSTLSPIRPQSNRLSRLPLSCKPSDESIDWVRRSRRPSTATRQTRQSTRTSFAYPVCPLASPISLVCSALIHFSRVAPVAKGTSIYLKEAQGKSLALNATRPSEGKVDGEVKKQKTVNADYVAKADEYVSSSLILLFPHHSH